MSDASPAEPATGSGTLEAGDPAAPSVLTMSGYCAECGTWDAHGPTCSACGYDFAGTTAPKPVS